jgi:hypothetical protein
MGEPIAHFQDAFDVRDLLPIALKAGRAERS